MYDRAIAICPERAEARHGASRYFRRLRKFVDGFYYAEAGLPPHMPSEGLFIQPWIYQYGLQDEYAVNAYCTGQYRACLANCLDILGKPDLPVDVRERIAKLSRDALGKMLDPIWGFAPSAYRTEFMPQWQF